MSEFWCQLLEYIYLPINTFIGYDVTISSIIVIGFVFFQFWLIYTCVLKPFRDCFKMLISLFFGG